MMELGIWFQWLMRSTLQVSLLVFIVLAVKTVLRTRLAPRWHYCLWLLVVVRMLMPSAPQSSLSVFNLIGGPIERVTLAPVAEIAQAVYVAETPIPELPLQTETTQPMPQAVAPQETTAFTFPPLVQVLPIIWLGGAIVLAIYVFAGNFRLWSIVKCKRPVTDSVVLDLLEDCKGQMNIHTPLAVVETDRIASPALFGFLRPRLLLPEGMLGALDRSQLRHILLHELAHLKRGDIYLGWLVAILQTVHWFNPIVWFGFHRMRSDRELACDNLALSAMGAEEPAEYGRTIVKLLEDFSAPKYAPSLAGILEERSQLKRRISMIAKFKKSSYRISVGAVMLIAVLSVVSLTDGHTERDGERLSEKAFSEAVEREVYLPEKVVLDLATGEIITPLDVFKDRKGSDAEFLQALDRYGKGDLVSYHNRDIVNIGCTRGAKVSGVDFTTLENGMHVFFFKADEFPADFTVTTKEGRSYKITVLEAEKGSCRLQYQLMNNAGFNDQASSEARDILRRLVPGDVVEISVFELFQEGQEAIIKRQVSESGLISLPESEPIRVQGMYQDQLRETITQLYDNILDNPSVAVIILKNVSLRPGVKTKQTDPQGDKLSIPIEIDTTADFLPGDSIEITEILGSTGRIETGRTYTIKGKYKLASQDKAMLHLYATNGETTCEQGPVINKGQGEFTRTFSYQEEGWLHLSYYPAKRGSSFANLYFNHKNGYVPDITKIKGMISVVTTHENQLQAYLGTWEMVEVKGNHPLSRDATLTFKPDGIAIIEGTYTSGEYVITKYNYVLNNNKLVFTDDDQGLPIDVLSENGQIIIIGADFKFTFEKKKHQTDPQVAKPSIPIEIDTTSDFLPGDSIEITEITGTSARIEAGQTYTIKGKYKLSSRDEAQIHLISTNGSTSSIPNPTIKRGRGEFTRTLNYMEGNKDTWLQLKLVQANGNESFGNLYFYNKNSYVPRIPEIRGGSSRSNVRRAPKPDVDESAMVSAIEKISLTGDDVIKVKADGHAGFNFPFYLFIPKTVDKNQKVRILVEPNNTGTSSDDLEVHREKALRSVRNNYPNRIARSLGSPLLVPTFPRPKSNWRAYTHSLDRDTLEINKGKLKRIDLQLTAMIKYAQELLRVNGFKIDDQIFMHGFSASAKFANRYSYLHPEMVKAVAVGGVNGLPTLPVSKWNGYELPFPIGLAGIEEFIDKPFNEKTFSKVAHYIYMGAFDRNDTLPSRDAWSEKEAGIIKNALAEKMMPDRWELTQKIYNDQNINAQCITYNGVSHSIKNEMLDDVVKFFKANSGGEYNPIEPHQYPFVEFKKIKQAHVNGLYWSNDERLPEKDRKNPFERTFLIGIEEWIDGQDYRQLGDFHDNAGFNFVLKADGQKDIAINEKNFSGTRSSHGSGKSFQAFYVKLNNSQFRKIVSGVSYSLEPLNKSDEYFWTVNDGVGLTKSKPTSKSSTKTRKTPAARPRVAPTRRTPKPAATPRTPRLIRVPGTRGRAAPTRSRPTTRPTTARTPKPAVSPQQAAKNAMFLMEVLEKTFESVKDSVDEGNTDTAIVILETQKPHIDILVTKLRGFELADQLTLFTNQFMDVADLLKQANIEKAKAVLVALAITINELEDMVREEGEKFR